MNQFILLFSGIGFLIVGAMLGYFTRQSIAKRNYGTIEARLEKKIQQTKEESETILEGAKEKARQVLEKTKKDIDARREEFFKTEKILLERESLLNEKISNFENKETEFNQKVDKLKDIKVAIENLQKETEEKLEQVTGLTKEEAKEELFNKLEQNYQKDLLERV